MEVKEFVGKVVNALKVRGIDDPYYKGATTSITHCSGLMERFQGVNKDGVLFTAYACPACEEVRIFNTGKLPSPRVFTFYLKDPVLQREMV